VATETAGFSRRLNSIERPLVYCVNNIPSSACECRLYASVDLSQRRGDQWSAILVWDKAGNVSMRAMDVMTTGVITVDPDMSVQAVASSFPSGGSAGSPLSMSLIGWSVL
jgi:CBS domain-containing protein